MVLDEKVARKKCRNLLFWKCAILNRKICKVRLTKKNCNLKSNGEQLILLLENWRKAPWQPSILYLLDLIVCMYNVKTAEPIEPNIFLVTHKNPERIYGQSKFKNAVWKKMSSLIILKIHKQTKSAKKWIFFLRRKCRFEKR